MNNVADILLAKRQELLNKLALIKEEAREAGEPEVRDYTDTAAEDTISAETLDEASEESDTLKQVEDALKRLANGTYGKCVVCGKPIEPARLAAIPWTPYCLEHSKN